MKRTHSRWLLAVILASTSLTLQAIEVMPQTSDVVITVLGKVVTRPCTVSTSDKESSVDLGDIYTYELASKGSVLSKNKEVILNLTNCPNETSKVKATFSGIPDEVSGNYYKNNGTAKNIEIELYNDEITLPSGSTIWSNVSGGNASFPLKVRARSQNGNATQGSIEATINVTYTYE